MTGSMWNQSLWHKRFTGHVAGEARDHFSANDGLISYIHPRMRSGVVSNASAPGVISAPDYGNVCDNVVFPLF